MNVDMSPDEVSFLDAMVIAQILGHRPAVPAKKNCCPKCGEMTAKAGNYHHDDEWCLNEEVGE